jgi:hypothetical protein
MGTKAAKFLTDNPERTAQLLEQAFSFAEKFRETANYDRRWPTAYGLERMICATAQDSCQSPPSLPKEQWNKAWGEAKLRVTTYYQAAKPPAVNENSVYHSQ